MSQKKKRQPKGQRQDEGQRELLLAAKIALATETIKLIEAVIELINDLPD